MYNADDFDVAAFYIAIAIADLLGRSIEGGLALILSLAEEQKCLVSIYEYQYEIMVKCFLYIMQGILPLAEYYKHALITY